MPRSHAAGSERDGTAGDRRGKTSQPGGLSSNPVGVRGVTWLLQRAPILRDDDLARAGTRLVYNFSCPATRVSSLSAARELALVPAFGTDGLWTRLPTLAIPAAFVWGGRDRLVSPRFAERVAESLPGASQLLLPCVGHWMNGPHHRCLAEAVASLMQAEEAEDPRGAPSLPLGACSERSAG